MQSLSFTGLQFAGQQPSDLVHVVMEHAALPPLPALPAV
jgi:hypothetical protein